MKEPTDGPRRRRMADEEEERIEAPILPAVPQKGDYFRSISFLKISLSRSDLLCLKYKSSEWEDPSKETKRGELSNDERTTKEPTSTSGWIVKRVEADHITCQ